jgi:hypothetical protein
MINAMSAASARSGSRRADSGALAWEQLIRLMRITAVVLTACVAPAQESAASRPVDGADMRAAFELLSSLDAPATADCPFGEVTGRTQRGRGGSCTTGFLIHEDETGFTVWFLDLELVRFARGCGVSFVPKSFDDEVVRVYAALANRRLDTGPGEYTSSNDFRPLSIRTELVSLARECFGRNHQDLATKCCSMALAFDMGRNLGRTEARTLVDAVKQDVEKAWIWRTTLACGDPQVSREDLLRAFERCVKNFPDGRWVKQASEMRTELARMVKEDADHRQSSHPFSKMSRADQIDDLVFRLRDQRGHQYVQPGHATFTMRDNSPAAQLVKMGDVAVPRLIQALDDRRLTRTVGFWRDFNFSHYVLRVGDCAAAILELIAGQEFFVPRSTFSYMSKDGLEAEVRAKVNRWWEEKHPAPAPQSRAAESRR